MPHHSSNVPDFTIFSHTIKIFLGKKGEGCPVSPTPIVGFDSSLGHPNPLLVSRVFYIFFFKVFFFSFLLVFPSLVPGSTLTPSSRLLVPASTSTRCTSLTETALNSFYRFPSYAAFPPVSLHVLVPTFLPSSSSLPVQQPFCACFLMSEPPVPSFPRPCLHSFYRFLTYAAFLYLFSVCPKSSPLEQGGESTEGGENDSSSRLIACGPIVQASRPPSCWEGESSPGVCPHGRRGADGGVPVNFTYAHMRRRYSSWSG